MGLPSAVQQLTATRRRGQHRRGAGWAVARPGLHARRTGTGQRCAARGGAPAPAMREAARRRGRGARFGLSTGRGRIARTLGLQRCARWRHQHQQAAAVASRAAHASRTLSSSSQRPAASSSPAALSRSSARPAPAIVAGCRHVCAGIFSVYGGGAPRSSVARSRPAGGLPTSRPACLSRGRGGHPAVATHQGRCAAGGRWALALALRSARARRLLGRGAAVLWRRRNTKPA